MEGYKIWHANASTGSNTLSFSTTGSIKLFSWFKANNGTPMYGGTVDYDSGLYSSWYGIDYAAQSGSHTGSGTITHHNSSGCSISWTQTSVTVSKANQHSYPVYIWVIYTE